MMEACRQVAITACHRSMSSATHISVELLPSVHSFCPPSTVSSRMTLQMLSCMPRVQTKQAADVSHLTYVVMFYTWHKWFCFIPDISGSVSQLTQVVLFHNWYKLFWWPPFEFIWSLTTICYVFPIPYVQHFPKTFVPGFLVLSLLLEYVPIWACANNYPEYNFIFLFL